MMKVLLVALLISSSNGFLQGSPSTSASSRIRQSTQVTKLPMAGFGGGANASSKKKKTPLKLKPKLQWDRYVSLKHSDKVQVGIRLISESADTPSEWLEVGRIKTKENENIPLAVAIQRAIIAEHGRRLYPLQVSKKMTCEWGYLDSGDEDWKAVDVKTVMKDASADGIEKSIGFEGKPDPASGFYCVYDNGKLKLGEESSFGS